MLFKVLLGGSDELHRYKLIANKKERSNTAADKIGER